jgi:short-subunit dehydrogenase
VPRELSGSVVVITGASSGIGRAAAHAFAARRSKLVLAARAGEPLDEVAEECRRAGAEALAITTDVRDEGAVLGLADHAVERFGRIDVWVNCAGVIVYGGFEQVPSDVFRNVIETNLFGQVHGARAALPHFRARATGVLINMSSVWGRVTTPDVSAYVTSKFAVRAFSECLHEELRDVPGIDVATMLPAAVDTPIFARAANYAGRRVRPIPPLLDPVVVAQGIVKCAERPKREVTYGRVARGLELLHALIPGLYQRLAPPAFTAGNYGARPAERTAGSVSSPRGGYAVHGGWRAHRRRTLADAALAAASGAVRGLWRGR